MPDLKMLKSIKLREDLRSFQGKYLTVSRVSSLADWERALETKSNRNAHQPWK